MEYVPTGSKVIDNILDGGWPIRATSGIFSGFDLGKSFLMYQTACYLWKETGLGTIYVDTESHYLREKTRKRYLDFFKDRWGIEEEPNIDFIFPDDIDELATLLGKDITISAEPGSKQIQVYPNNLTSKYESDLAKKLETGDYGFLVIDSFTQPIKEEIPVPPRQNFPPRSAVESAILGRLSPLSKHYDIASVITLHETKDPAQGHYDTGNPVGGRALRFHTKYLLQLKGSPKKEERTIGNFRYPGKPSVRTKGDSKEVKLAENKGFIP